MKPLVIANWKCNPVTTTEAKRLFNSVKEGLKNIKDVEVVICPPFIYLLALKANSHKAIKFGGQNCFFEKGPFTGEISPQMLKNLGCQYVILGHSERRALGESDEMINKKIKAVLKEGLKPILCIGEKDQEFKTKEIKNQLRGALSIIKISDLENLIIAYEPVWAIGTKNPCDFKDAKKANSSIREILAEFFGESMAKNILVLYGGSLNSEIAAGYIKESKMDGLLVGGASLDAEEFVKLVKKVARALIPSP